MLSLHSLDVPTVIIRGSRTKCNFTSRSNYDENRVTEKSAPSPLPFLPPSSTRPATSKIVKPGAPIDKLCIVSQGLAINVKVPNSRNKFLIITSTNQRIGRQISQVLERRSNFASRSSSRIDFYRVVISKDVSYFLRETIMSQKRKILEMTNTNIQDRRIVLYRSLATRMSIACAVGCCCASRVPATSSSSERESSSRKRISSIHQETKRSCGLRGSGSGGGEEAKVGGVGAAGRGEESTSRGEEAFASIRPGIDDQFVLKSVQG